MSCHYSGKAPRTLIAAGIALAAGSAAQAALMQTVSVSDASGLSATATFTLLDPTTLEVRLRHTSTGAPGWFDGAAGILTGVSWDFDAVGVNPGEVEITGGTIVIGASSFSVNFTTGFYGAGTDVSGEWGYSNTDGTGMLWNFISSNRANVAPIGPGPNLDGPSNIDGPQGGLTTAALAGTLGGLGAIQDEIVATLTLNQALGNLDFLDMNGARFEWGSDALFLDIPTPGVVAPLAAAGLLGLRRRRA